MRNRLLASLPVRDYRRIAPLLETVSLAVRDVLQQPGALIREVYFPGDGFASIVTVLGDGSQVEVATVGREGMIGISAILDQRRGDLSRTMVQAAVNTCYRMSIEAFRLEMARRGSFYSMQTAYAQAHIGFVMQSTACNAKHSIEQRFARW